MKNIQQTNANESSLHGIYIWNMSLVLYIPLDSNIKS
jgi:hypothetical protein